MEKLILIKFKKELHLLCKNNRKDGEARLRLKKGKKGREKDKRERK